MKGAGGAEKCDISVSGANHKPRLPAFETVPDPWLTLPRAFSISPSVLPLCSIFDYFNDLTGEIDKVCPAPSSSAFLMEDLSVMTGFLKVFLPLSNNILILGQQFFSPVEPSWDYALLSLPVLSTDLLESLWGWLKVLLHSLPRLMPLTSFKRFCDDSPSAFPEVTWVFQA